MQINQFFNAFDFAKFSIITFLMCSSSLIDASEKKVTIASLKEALVVKFLCSECDFPFGPGCMPMKNHLIHTHQKSDATVIYGCQCCDKRGRKKREMIGHLVENHKAACQGSLNKDQDIDLLRMIVSFNGSETILKRPKRQKEEQLLEKETRHSLRAVKRVRIMSECDDLEKSLFGDKGDVNAANALLSLSNHQGQ